MWDGDNLDKVPLAIMTIKVPSHELGRTVVRAQDHQGNYVDHTWNFALKALANHRAAVDAYLAKYRLSGEIVSGFAHAYVFAHILVPLEAPN